MRTFLPAVYRSMLVLVGTSYVEWGNYPRARWYFHQFLAAAQPGDDGVAVVLANQALAKIYLRQHHYTLARHYIDRALAYSRTAELTAVNQRVTVAHSLVLKSAILLAQGQVAAAGQLLPRAQHLTDSLHLLLSGRGGVLELAATWARYYTARHELDRAEQAWLLAYHQASTLHLMSLRLTYLRELGHFYQQRGRPDRAAPYALTATVLADSLDAIQRLQHLSHYEVTQADRAQQARLARLRLM